MFLKKLEDSLYHYLNLLTVPAPNTFFKNIKELELGHYLEIDDNSKIAIKKYWDISDYINKTNETSVAEATSFENCEDSELEMYLISLYP